MYQYPYGNAQQLNLDWIISKLQELESGSGGGADLEEVANALVSASFDATIPYRKFDYAFYDGKLYRALNDTIGAFNPADWLEVTLGADIPVLTRLVNADSALITTLQNMLQNLGSDDVDNESNVTGTNVSDALGTLNGAINDKMPAKPTNIELKPQSGASNGGYIDFHYGGSAADYTSRLIESANGVLSISGGLQLGSPLPVASGGTGNSSVDTAPTENSTKMVTSGGVFGAINDDPKMKGNFIAQNAYIEISKVNQSDPSVMMQINLMNNTGTEVGLYMGLINTLGQVAVAGAIPIANLSITTGTNKIKIQNTSGSISYYLNIVVFNRTAPIQLYRSDTGLTS